MARKPKKAPESAAGVATRVLRAEARRLPGLRKAVSVSQDPEAVHDLRVAIRRSRTAVRLFRPILAPSTVALDGPLQVLFRELGMVRDFDLAIAGVEQLPEAHRDAIRARLELARSATMVGLSRAVVDAPVLDAFRQATRSPLLTDSKPINPKRLVEDLHAKVKESTKRLKDGWDLSEFHRLRRRAKRLRYAVEFFQPRFGSSAQAYAARMKDIQDRMGKVMDRIAMATALDQISGLDGEAMEVVHATAENLRQSVGEDRKLIREIHKELCGKDWQKLHTTL